MNVTAHSSKVLQVKELNILSSSLCPVRPREEPSLLPADRIVTGELARILDYRFNRYTLHRLNLRHGVP